MLHSRDGLASVVRSAALLVRHPLRRRELFSQMSRAGPAALPVVALLAASTGGVLAFQTGVELVRLEAGPLVPRIVALSLTRELAPVLTALILAGRVGAGMAAELAGMRVTEQIVALRAMGVGIGSFLVAPRVIALALATPALTVVFEAIAMATSCLAGTAWAGLSPRLYLEEAALAVGASDLALGLVKSLVFGLILGLVSCGAGLSASESGGQAAVGHHTAKAVVWSTALVILADWPLTRLCHGVTLTITGR
jgi:phospholipid/cholesterol/gamma-HCH transport system permease protein